MGITRRDFVAWAAVAGTVRTVGATPLGSGELVLENEHYRIAVDRASGAISSLFVKRNRAELINEKRLAANFRMLVPLPEYQCNYVDGMASTPTSVRRRRNIVEIVFDGLPGKTGVLPIGFSYSIELRGSDIVFRSKLDNRSSFPVAELWFPRLGGLTSFGTADASLAVPGYALSCRHEAALFRKFPGSRNLGSDAPEYVSSYPCASAEDSPAAPMSMPWWSIHDERSDTSLYLGYHDRVLRASLWHSYLYPDARRYDHADDNWLTEQEAAGAPRGIVFSHIRLPFTRGGQRFESGEFVLSAHAGDWQTGGQNYRAWFSEHFPLPHKPSWLRQQRTWFTSIIFQPEDRIRADYKRYDRWCRDAEAMGIRCHELVGWNKGGLERDYPAYWPDERLGGWEGYRALQKDIRSRGAHCLTFVNYNIIDSAGSEFARLRHLVHQDLFGSTPNWMAWGESTLIARLQMSVRRHLLTSVVPELNQLLEERFLKLVSAGAQGFQIDKLVVGSALDFNPLNTRPPDEALCEGLVEAVVRLVNRCREIDPDFSVAAEAHLDRYLSVIDVLYRACDGYEITPLRIVFPECTAVRHIGAPGDYRGINGAVLTGAVICLEPLDYQDGVANPMFRELDRYVQEIERLRGLLETRIFLSKFQDRHGAQVTRYEGQSAANGVKPLYFGVHKEIATDMLAVVVANDSPQPVEFDLRLTDVPDSALTKYTPFSEPTQTDQKARHRLEAYGLAIFAQT